MIKFIFRSVAVLFFCATLLFSQTQIESISDISLAPVSTFKNFCSRCHGEEGSSYGKTFGKLKEDSLLTITEDMMFGPGGLNPSKTEVLLMADYNKSLPGRNPFGTILNLNSFLNGKDKYLKIETSPNTELKTDNEDIIIKKQKDIFELSFDSSKIKSAKISFYRNGKLSSIDFPGEVWTH